MICKNCKWKRQIAENLRMLGQWGNSTENIWNSEEFLTLTCSIGLLDLTGKRKWTGKVWLYGMGENKLSLESATEYVDSGNSNNSNPYIGNLVDSTWSPVVLI